MKLVYVPVVFPQGVHGPGFVESALGWPEQVAGRVDLVEARLCVIGERLRTDATGRDLVRFRNGVECWVYPGPERRFDPDEEGGRAGRVPFLEATAA